jgi:Ankyrin repeat
VLEVLQDLSCAETGGASTIDTGLDLAHMNAKGQTVLHIAVERGLIGLRIAKRLVELGADKNIRDN